MRLGIVPYSNAKPLIAGLDCPIFEAPPSQLPSLAGPDDIILGPIVVAFEDPSLYILEGAGIGSFGPVETVKLFFNKPMDVIPALCPCTGQAPAGIQFLQEIRSISLDGESKTSAALLKVLLNEKYKLSRGIRFLVKYQCDASLLIGDKVWEQGDKPSLDLGQAWTEWTNLPFVYACWMTKNPDIGREWKPKLIALAKKNLGNLEKISNDPKLLKYWRRLCYELGPKQKEGIGLFQKYWAEIENKPILKLNWI